MYPIAARIVNGYNGVAPESERPMMHSFKNKEFYSETEAAQALGISIARLHQLLDDNLFNDGTLRPDDVTFRASDLVVLGFWHRTTPNPKVVRMPNRA